MRLERVFQRLLALLKPLRVNKAHDRHVLLSKQGVGVTHADTGGRSHNLRVQSGIGKPRVNCSAQAQQGQRTGGGNTRLTSLHGLCPRHREQIESLILDDVLGRSAQVAGISRQHVQKRGYQAVLWLRSLDRMASHLAWVTQARFQVTSENFKHQQT